MIRLASLLLAVATISAASQATAAEQRPWRCLWVRGRMTIGSGTPAVRIWPRGTHRMLGVVNPQKDYDAGEMLPPKLRKLMRPENDYTVWGEYHVCPIVPERAGWMRFVTIDKARNLFRRF